MPQDFGFGRRGHDRRRAIRPLADAENTASDRGEYGRRFRTGASTRRWRAGASCSITVGTRSTASCDWAGIPTGLAAQLETRRFHEYPLEDTASVDLHTAAGVSNIFLTWAAEERANTIEIDGDQGADSRRIGDAVVLNASNAQERRWPCPPSLSDGSHHPDWFDGVAEDFVSCSHWWRHVAISTRRSYVRAPDRRRSAVERCRRRLGFP